MTEIYFAKATDGRTAQKRYRVVDDVAVQVKKDDYPYLFAYERRDPADLRELAVLLTKVVEFPQWMLVMGRPLIKSGERKAVYFEDYATNFWIIDLDGVPIEGTTEETIVRCLPFLRGHEYVYHYSQSAKIKKGLRVRVICNVKPMMLPECVAYARYYNDLLTSYEAKAPKYIDSSIYEPCHPVFTARPDIDFADPIQDRVHYVEGDTSPVTLADLPRLVEIKTKGVPMVFDELPRMPGTWGSGDGFDRAKNSLRGLVMLKAYMGDEYFDIKKRTELFLEMIKAAGGVEEDLKTYATFAARRGHIIKKELTGEQTVWAIPNEDHSINLEAAEPMLREIIKRAVESKEPKVFAVNVTMGVGKTHETIRQIGAHTRFLKDGDPFGRFNVDYYAPTIKMAEDGARMAPPQQLAAMVERGRGQVNDDGEPMCVKHDAVKAIQGVVDDISSFMCRRKTGDTEELCPHYYSCPWQNQHLHVNEFDIRFRSHEYLALPMRTESHENYRPVDFIVIDEASFGDALIHVQDIEIGELISPRHDLHGDVLKFATVLNEGLTLERLAAAGLTEEAFTNLIHAEEALQPIPPVSPKMDTDETTAAVKGYEPGWHRFASVWRRMRDSVRDQHLNRIRVSKEWLTLRWKSPMAGLPLDEDGKPKVPILILSGTMKREVIEQFLHIDEYHEIDVRPHENCVITQSDLSGAKSECLYGSSEKRRKRGETDKKKIKAAEDVRAFVKEQSKGRVLISYKDLEELLAHEPSAHFKAIEGINAYKGKDLVVYGRPLAPPREIEDIAAAIFQDDLNRILELKNFWYPSHAVARRGEGFAYTPYHPDGRAEAVRWMMCEGEMMQSIARSRYVRQAYAPDGNKAPLTLNILILNKTPLPLRIDRVVSSARLHPEWEAYEKADVLPLSHSALKRKYPAIFKDGRTGERNMRDLTPDALIVRHRTGKTVWSKTAVEYGASRAGLGEWKVVDDTDGTQAEAAHNLIALRRREYRDILATVGREELTDMLKPVVETPRGLTIDDGEVVIHAAEYRRWKRWNRGAR